MLRGVRWTLRALVSVAPALLGCTVGDLDPTGKNCPCPSDFTCDKASHTCVPGSASSSSDGGANGCSGVCGTPGCGTCPTTPAIVVYDIDATEVTAANYQAFLATNPDPANQPPYCVWNESFAPLQNSADSGCDAAPDLTQYPNHPADCIDWCDAHAYCAWAKRHLCGRIGGGILRDTEGADATKSEWYRACSAAGTLAYPYGNTYDATKCDTLGAGYGGTPIDVKQAMDCIGGYPGLYDMSGNVEEWEDGCGTGVNPDDPSDDDCPVRGGAYWTGATDSRCDGLMYKPPRKTQDRDFGFRCCGPTQ